jgi:nicotinamidase/pyrazinamidase
VIVPSTPGNYSVDGVGQVLLEKQKLDCFTNPNLAGLLNRFAAGRYVVYGVVTEICVRCAAEGLLRTGKPVDLVTDAVMHLQEVARDRLFEEVKARGGRLVSESDLSTIV